MLIICSMASSPPKIGVMEHLAKLVLSPEVSPEDGQYLLHRRGLLDGWADEEYYNIERS
jgi:hypothetical protein